MDEASITAIVDEVTLETKVVKKVEFRHMLMRAYSDGYSACADHAFDRTEKELSAAMFAAVDGIMEVL